MKEGPFQVYAECFQNPGEESVETSQGRGFPCENAWDKGWVSGEQPEEQLSDAEKNHSVTKAILGEEKPPVLSRCWYLKAQREVSQLARPGAEEQRNKELSTMEKECQGLNLQTKPPENVHTALLFSASKSPISGR